MRSPALQSDRRASARGPSVRGLPILVAAALLVWGCPRVREFQPGIPQGGRAVSITVNPTDDQRLVVAAETGGLFESRDGGATWEHFEDLPAYRMTDVEFSPSDANLLIATATEDFKATNNGCIWRSSNGGTTWSQPAGSIPAAGPRCRDMAGAHSVSFEPGTDNVYVGTDCGLAISTDLGATWTHEQLLPLPSINSQLTQDRVWSVLARSGGRILAAGQTGVWYSTDGGASWTESVGAPLAERAARNVFAASPFDPNDIFFAAAAGSQTELYLSSDGGATWDFVRDGHSVRQGWVRVGAGQPGASEFDVFFGSGLQVFRATYADGDPPTPLAAGWQQLTVDHADQSDLAFAADGRTPILMTSDGGVHVTTDGGSTWVLTGAGDDGYGALQITEVAGQFVSGSSEHTDLYFGTQDNRVWGSANGGLGWINPVCCEGYYIRTPRESVDHAGTKVTGRVCCGGRNFLADAHLENEVTFPNAPDGDTDPTMEGIPFLVAPGTRIQVVDNDDLDPTLKIIMLTQDHGATWQNRGTLDLVLRSRPIVAGPATDPVIYWAVARPSTTYNGISRQGLVRIDNVLGPGSLVVTDADVSGLGSLGIFPTMFAWYRVFGVDPSDPDHLVAPDLDSGEVKYSLDAGQSWAVDSDLTDLVLDSGVFRFNWREFVHVQSIEFDPAYACHVAVGTAQNGIFQSGDAGASWVAVPDTTQITNLSSIFFTDGDDLIVSTYGRGLWKVLVDRPEPPVGLPVGAPQCTPYELSWPPPLMATEPELIDVADPVPVPFVGPGDPPICAQCDYLVVGWGRVTDLAMEGSTVRSVSVSGGTVRRLDSEGRERELGVPVEIRPSPGEYGGGAIFGELKKERRSVRALVLEGSKLRAIVAAHDDTFAEGEGPLLTLDGDGAIEGEMALAPGRPARVLGRGFRPTGEGESYARLLLDGETLAEQVVVDERGRFSAEIKIDRRPGDYVLEVIQKDPKALVVDRRTLRVVVQDFGEE